MPEKEKVPVHSLSIFLLKESANKLTRMLATPGDLKRVSVGRTRGKIGDLYVRQNPAAAPRWLRFFGDSIAESLPKLFNASNGAVLLVEAGGRTFALTFGQGRHLLAAGAWEENFGLRVTLNSVDPKKLRSIDRRTFDAYTSHTRTQTSIEGDVSAFGLNVEQDLLRAATGQPQDGTLGRRMTGMDSLAVAVPVLIRDLPDLLERYLERFEDDSYRQTFPWVDHIGEVRDRQLRDKLDDELLGVIAETQASTPKAWLAVPALIDWARVEGFAYSRSPRAQKHSDLEIRDFLDALNDPSSLSVESLHLHHAYAIGVEDGQVLERWSIYECLYSEIEKEGVTYLLSGGRWYRVDRDFVTAVNRYVKRLVSPASLPRYVDKSEGDYNKRVAKESRGELALLDRRLVRIGGSTVETCDLYSATRQFIHVKRYGGSSVLSHLFAQGGVSASAFAQDPEYRGAFNDLLPPSHRLADPTQRPEPPQFEVVYAVASNSSDPIDRALPFFSRLNLRNAARQLTGYGFRVSLVKVEAA